MKNIYLVQPSTENVSVAYFPYAAGCLASYAWSFEDIRQAYTLKETIFLREDLDAVIERFEHPFLIGFSNYIWNFEYNKALAKRLKQRFPDCLMVFGGPQIPFHASLLEQYPFIDILQHGEGEISFCALLRTLREKGDLSAVDNLSFRTENGIVTTAVSAAATLDFPSPYQSGFIDDIMRKNPTVHFDALIETNRGCPHKCAYCSWGGVKGKVRCFPAERVYADLEWCASRKIAFIGFADGNFGMFPRDEDFVDKLIELKKTTGYPQKFQVSYVSYTKGSWDRMFRITKKLSDNDLCKGVTLSFQSMSPLVQKNIGRNNMNAESYKYQLQAYAAADIPTYSELILGLPGETVESWKAGIEEILELGQHTSLFVHLCEWLPLAQMAEPGYMARHGVGYTKIPLNQPHAKKCTDGVTEYSRIVTSTASMSEKDWVEMNLFSVCVLCFHHLRLLQCVALYLHFEMQVRYSDFYTALLDYLLQNNTVFVKIKALFENVIENKGEAVMYDSEFGDIAWGPEEYAFLKIISEKESFFADMKDFLTSFFGDEEMLEEVLRYQSFCLKERNKPYLEQHFHYRWKEYFDSILKNKPSALMKQKTVYRITSPEKYTDGEDYAKKVIWYGRKGGRNIYTDEIQSI